MRYINYFENYNNFVDLEKISIDILDGMTTIFDDDFKSEIFNDKNIIRVQSENYYDLIEHREKIQIDKLIFEIRFFNEFLNEWYIYSFIDIRTNKLNIIAMEGKWISNLFNSLIKRDDTFDRYNNYLNCGPKWVTEEGFYIFYQNLDRNNIYLSYKNFVLNWRSYYPHTDIYTYRDGIQLITLIINDYLGTDYKWNQVNNDSGTNMGNVLSSLYKVDGFKPYKLV